MNKLSILALAAVPAAATPALAQAAAPTGSFSGPRIEAIGGWDRLQAGGGHDDGIVYGVGAGYDLQRGNTVFGIEGEASDSSQKERVGTLTQNAKRDLYVGGRIGAVVGGNNLVYAKAGYTNARYSVTGTGTGTLAAGNLDGVRVGAGIEHQMGRSYVKAEYRYSNYEQGVSRNQVVAGIGLRF